VTAVPVLRRRTPCSAPIFARPHLLLLLFPFPPHIPTDIVVSWRVRRAGLAQVGHFRHAHLYGKFQKSTAATQAVPGLRTPIPTFARRERRLLGAVRKRLEVQAGIRGVGGADRNLPTYPTPPGQIADLPYIADLPTYPTPPRQIC
jgi:hypothetical protein